MGVSDSARQEATSVSIVMSTFNGERFLDEQLDSLASQTSLPLELIVADDCSTDRSLAVVEVFAQRAPFPVVIKVNDRRLGYGQSFLSAATLARGEFIAFCDQDDIWHPEKLATAVKSLNEELADLFVHSAEVIDDDGNQIGEFYQQIASDHVYMPLELGPWSVFYGFSMVFRRRLLGLVDIESRGKHTFEHEGLLSHDLWIYFLATSLGRTVVSRRPLAKYRRHGKNITPHIFGGGLRAWTSSLGLAADPRLPRDAIAEHRSALMRVLSASSVDPDVSQAAQRAEVYWRRIANFERTRMKVYADAGVARRALWCGRLAVIGGYRRHLRGGLGQKLMVKDLLAGVLGFRRKESLQVQATG